MKITYDETIKNYRLEEVAKFLRDCEKICATTGWESYRFFHLCKWADDRAELEVEIVPDPKDRQVIYLKLHSPRFIWVAQREEMKKCFEAFFRLKGVGVYGGRAYKEEDGVFFFSHGDHEDFYGANTADGVAVIVFDD